MNTAIAIGTQSFEKIRGANSFYVDKTQFIKEWWENKDDVTLITRPRRFGFYHGFVLGLLVAMVRTFHDQRREERPSFLLGVLNLICKIYTTVIRGTPMMVQLLIMGFVIFKSSRNLVGIAALSFGINSGAYVAEIIRGGLMSVDSGQMEAGRSLGLNYIQTMWHIIIPQAIKNILPALGNELITLLKETSIVTVIGLRDLTKAAQLITGKTYGGFMALFGVALIYLGMVMVLSWLVNRLERRLRSSER